MKITSHDPDVQHLAIRMELTRDEALDLLAITEKVGGCTERSGRKTSDYLRSRLSELFRIKGTERDARVRALRGSVMFEADEVER